MVKRTKKVSTKPVGKAIQVAIKQLQSVRATRSPQGKKRIDVNLKILKSCYAAVKRGCLGNWNP